MSIKQTDNKGASFGISIEHLARAKNVIPGQSQTFSKGWTQYPLGACPIFASHADGARIWDVDGNEFIDWPMALGPLLLGHNHPAINTALKRQLSSGVAFSLPTSAELMFSERLIRWFPYAEKVRFGKNGSDATTGAIRAARAFTGRELILCCGYHGWQDWFIGTTARNSGVPLAVRELTQPFRYNDIGELEALISAASGQVAAIIMEPMGLEKPAPGYLGQVRALADKHGIVLIFDECWTGFRIHRQGAYGSFGVAPDLACFGKALGNGVPISAIIGRGDIMDTFEEIFFSFTFGGDLLGIAAADAVLSVLEREPVLEDVADIGTKLMDGIEELIDKHKLRDWIGLSGYPARHAFSFRGDGKDGLLLKSVFQQEATKGGILAAGWHAPSWSHDANDVSHTLKVYDNVFALLSRSMRQGNLSDKLSGEIVQTVFRKP